MIRLIPFFVDFVSQLHCELFSIEPVLEKDYIKTDDNKWRLIDEENDPSDFVIIGLEIYRFYSDDDYYYHYCKKVLENKMAVTNEIKHRIRFSSLKPYIRKPRSLQMTIVSQHRNKFYGLDKTLLGLE